MRRKLIELNNRAKAILSKADTEHRDLTEAEVRVIEEINAEFDRIAEQTTLPSRGRQAAPNALPSERRSKTDKGYILGYSNEGEPIQAYRNMKRSLSRNMIPTILVPSLPA